MRWKWLALAACLGAPAAAWSEVPPVTVVQERAPMPYPADQGGRPLAFRTAKATFATPPARIGVLQQGVFCGKTGDILWTDRVYNLVSPGFGRVFRTELEKSGYPRVPRPADVIFETAADKEQEKQRAATALQVGMLVKDVAVNLCVRGTTTEGGSYMKVFWQVFAPDQQKVVFEATTEGSYQTQGSENLQAAEMFLRSYAMAVRNLLADPGLQDAVKNTPVVAAPPKAADAEMLHLAGAKAHAEGIKGGATLLRSAVATIVTDSGSGSGFFIGTAGHLLTNQHVVGAARFVKVRLATGRELLGEVVRSDRERDVALVKTEPSGVPPLAVRTGEANVGDEVYALGSPLGEKFNTTMTRGILSGYRTLEGIRYLQSDVAILPGSSGGPLLDERGAVIGMTVAGLGARGAAGMNFFIPIAESLARLNVVLD